MHELEGEVEALKLVDLDREGLGEYRSQLKKLDGLESPITSIIDQSKFLTFIYSLAFKFILI